MPIYGLILVSQTNMDTGYQSMDLHQSPKTNKTWIPDANQWTYTSLLPYHRIQLPINGLMLVSSMDKTTCYKAKFMK